jgi:hypothetical protein
MKTITVRLSYVFAAAVAAGLLAQVPALRGAQVSADVKADYDRANSLNQRIANKMSGEIQNQPTWIPGSQKFWYAKNVRGGAGAHEFVLVDPAGPSKGAAFDHARLATAISTAASGSYTATTLPFQTFTYGDNMQSIDFAIGRRRGRRRTSGRRRRRRGSRWRRGSCATSARGESLSLHADRLRVHEAAGPSR